jgi:hypothetical protein
MTPETREYEPFTSEEEVCVFIDAVNAEMLAELDRQEAEAGAGHPLSPPA